MSHSPEPEASATEVEDRTPSEREEAMSRASAAGKYAWQAFFTFNLKDDVILNHVSRLKKSHVGGGMTQGHIDIEGANRSVDSMKNFLKDSFTLTELHKQDKKNPLGGRVYVMGHGNWQMGTIGGYNADFVAETLRTALDGTKVKVVSVLGCELGRDIVTGGSALVAVSCDSFAAKLHRHLKGFCDVLYARVFDVNVRADGTKRTSLNDNLIHHREASKVKFHWLGDDQLRDYVTYTTQEADEGSAERISELKGVEVARMFG
jgi:hypothetical protein